MKSEKELPFLRNPEILVGENDLTSLSYLHEPAGELNNRNQSVLLFSLFRIFIVLFRTHFHVFSRADVARPALNGCS